MNCENLTVGTASGIALDVLVAQKAVVEVFFGLQSKFLLGRIRKAILLRRRKLSNGLFADLLLSRKLRRSEKASSWDT